MLHQRSVHFFLKKTLCLCPHFLDPHLFCSRNFFFLAQGTLPPGSPASGSFPPDYSAEIEVNPGQKGHVLAIFPLFHNFCAGILGQAWLHRIAKLFFTQTQQLAGPTPWTSHPGGGGVPASIFSPGWLVPSGF